MTKFSDGQWYPPHMMDDRVNCDCKTIISDGGLFGGIASVHVHNGIESILAGGNDCPRLEEAQANARLITKSPEMYYMLQRVLDDGVPSSEIKELLSKIDGDAPFEKGI